MKKAESAYAYVRAIDNEEKILIPITSSQKPEIPEEIMDKWQRIVNVTARIMHVPTGLITRLTKEHLEIFIASQTEGNPYSQNDKDTLGIGMFCESVAGARDQLVIQDIETNEFWKNNPHAGLGMNAYLGVPIQWKDGEIFGTFCMLNDKTNKFSDEFAELMREFKEIIETDLNLIQAQQDLEEKLSKKEIFMRELHHRVKNHFNLLISLISLQAREKNIKVDDILADLQNRVQAIALIHEKLHMDTRARKIDLANYIKELTGIITSKVSSQKIHISYDIDSVTQPLDISVPIGLIISELISNSIKYAFEDIEVPSVQISMKMTEEHQLSITYSDNGKGASVNEDGKDFGNLGMKLIRLLTEQLSGEAHFSGDSGFSYKTVVKV